LRQNPRLAEDGHEVVVAIPTRDDVAVEVRDAAARDRGAEIESDIEGVRFEGRRQELLRHNNLVEEIGAFCGIQLLQFGDVAERNGQQVARIVRETV
jgi:hypothetical protein